MKEWPEKSLTHVCYVSKGHAYGLTQELLSEKLHLTHGADTMLLDERLLKALEVTSGSTRVEGAWWN